MKNIFFISVLLFVSLSIHSCGINEVDHNNYQPGFDPYTEISSIDLDGNNLKTIIKGTNAKFVPSKNIIIFGLNDLYSINLDGSNLIRITNFNNLSIIIIDNDIALNGEKIVISIWGNLYIVNYDGSNFTQLTKSNNDLEPHFSQNNNRIVFRRDWNICTMNNDGTEFKYISKHPDSSYYRNPYFVYNDRKILYYEESKVLNNILTIHFYDLELQKDTIFVQIHPSGFQRTQVDVSQGNKILFIESMFNRGAIRTFDFTNNEYLYICQGEYASFSNDGNKIILSNGQQIYSISSNGTDKKLIYEVEDDKKWISNPQFSSNNKIIFDKTYYMY